MKSESAIEHHDLEIRKFELEQRRHEMDARSKVLDLLRVRNEQAEVLLKIVEYLSSQQNDELSTVQDCTIESEFKRHGRNLGPLEEDLLNCAMKSLCIVTESIGKGLVD